MAADFNKCTGVQIVGFDDVDFIYDGVRFNVQCKRIHSAKQIKQNIEKASDQFTSRMKDSRIKGILCFSIDKLTGKENMILQVDSSEEIGPAIIPLINRFMNNHQHLWVNLPNINILGVLVSCKIVSWIKEGEGNLLTTCRQLVAHILPSAKSFQVNDRRLMTELSQTLSLLN